METVGENHKLKWV